MAINGTNWNNFEKSGDISHYIMYRKKLEEEKKKIEKSESSKKDNF